VAPTVAKIILKRNNKVGSLILLDFKTYCKATVTEQCGAGIKTDIESNGIE